MTVDENKNEKNNEEIMDVKLSFEDALEKLEGHVRTLEQGELTLDESLHIFEDGMKLAKFCEKKLDEAEQKIEIMVEKNGELVKEPFEMPDEKK
jgi:exodeoxyribonuclease VII small subunit